VSDVPPSDSTGPGTPSADELDRLAYDAVVRNAPRFGRFIGTGVAVGAVAGFGLGFILPNSTGVGRFTVGLLLALGFATIGGLVTAVLATGVDGTRKVPEGRPFPWEVPDAAPGFAPASPRDRVAPGDGPDAAAGDAADAGADAAPAEQPEVRE